MPPRAIAPIELNALVPHGLIATKRWLADQGLERHSLDNLIKSEQLIALAPGVYQRLGTILKWQGVISSLQRMGYSLTVGGLTALEMQGFGHYMSMTDEQAVHLYSSDPRLPWLTKLDLSATFHWHGNKRLWVANTGHSLERSYTREIPWGEQNMTLLVSTPERAICEALVDVPSKLSFEYADQMMQGLTSLSPRRLDELLHDFKHIGAKRLFFWLAERQDHNWFNKLDPKNYDLGKGKRVIAKKGRLNSEYQITVPQEMLGDPHE